MSMRGRAVFICGGEDRMGYDDWERDCPNFAEHAEHPLGYVDWHEWAKRMGKTHRQQRCSGCGRFAFWQTKVREAV